MNIPELVDMLLDQDDSHVVIRFTDGDYNVGEVYMVDGVTIIEAGLKVD